MKIQEHDLFRGAALSQLIEYAEEKAISICKVNNRFGHYMVNNHKNIFIKYRSNNRSPWRFNFSNTELKRISDIILEKKELYIVLICGSFSICVLDSFEVDSCVNIYGTTEQWISVSAKYGSSLWVKGSKGKIDYSIRHSDYPGKLFNMEDVIDE
ncbi:hypothetical protein QUF84_09070 [Fictibacillus enclensis]|uniref:hypothetical protein n=1 Tax=Fictibacillus enclensis TaxID=1017270 RepID=UPI0025A112A8|nr:hypothetical protein [Fictibacillus enclensis]MDM5337364.1 hypothetical protein [Fictibacillus enclensis]